MQSPALQLVRVMPSFQAQLKLKMLERQEFLVEELLRFGEESKVWSHICQTSGQILHLILHMYAYIQGLFGASCK